MNGGINPFEYALNNPLNKVDPLGLWAVWAGNSNVVAVGRGINFGGGIAIDSEEGLGYYGTAGRMVGVGASAGVEAGFFSGSMSGETTTFTFGLKFWSVGLIASQDGWGIVIGATLPKASLPFELTVAKNITTFTSLEDNQASKQDCSEAY